MRQPTLAARFGAASTSLALAIAGIWALHPLQTESVTYIVQRAESLMGLCYLAVLYCFIRSASTARPALWLALSFVACLAGMASKEVMVSAPLMVLLYDRTFVAGSFATAWRLRWRYYLCLAATWLVLAWLVASTGGRGGTAGFGTEITSWSYALTQCGAIVRYLALAVWPHALVFDYGTNTAAGFGEVWPQAILIVALVGATVVALFRRPLGGFLGAWFLLILAPSSSLVPIASQTMAEHRMYLSLAALIAALVVGLYAWLGRRAWWACATLALVGGSLTAARNTDYRSDLRLWTDTVAKRPENARAHNNLAKAFVASGRVAESVSHYEEAIRRQPSAPEPHNNLGLALAHLHRRSDAIACYRDALRLQPNYADAHHNLANALLADGKLAEALAQYGEALRLRPAFALAHSNLANALLDAGRPAEALLSGAEAVRLDPTLAEAHYNLGNAQAQSGRLPAALASYTTAVRLRPAYATAHNNLGNVLAELDRLPEAMVHYETALRLDRDYFEPRRNLALLLLHLDRPREALPHLETLVRLHPDDTEVSATLRRLRSGTPP